MPYDNQLLRLSENSAASTQGSGYYLVSHDKCIILCKTDNYIPLLKIACSMAQKNATELDYTVPPLSCTIQASRNASCYFDPPWFMRKCPKLLNFVYHW